MGCIFYIFGAVSAIAALVGLFSGSLALLFIGLVLAVIFFAVGTAKIRSTDGLSLTTRGLQSLGNGDVQVGIGHIENSIAVLRGQNQLTDLGVAELFLACALAVDGRPIESKNHFSVAKQLLEDPQTGAYARKPGSRPKFERIANVLESHLLLGVPDKQALWAILFG